MSNSPPVGIVIVLVCAAGCFALGRWLPRGWREKRCQKEQLARYASETRQQRRARQRRERR
jgi:hypothetical protein